LTAEGAVVHERVDDGGAETRPGVRVQRHVFLESESLGLRGIADLVELRRDESGNETAFPIEYKRGARKRWAHDEVQLCAQAFVLEEMLGVKVERGAIFYGASRRRRDVEFDDRLRAFTKNAILRFRALIASGRSPPAVRDARCTHCSLATVCLPSLTDGRRSARAWLDQELEE
jgi:CRISPR-associated exonuclease Cas4